MTPELSIIYVNFHSRQELYRSLKSLVEQSSISLEVIVVENGSGEDLESLKELYAEVRLIYSDQNLGFGKACNLAAQQARAEFVLLLNPDTWFSEPAADKALEAYRNLPGATRGVLTCRHVAEDGSFQACSFQRAQFPKWPFLQVPFKRLSTSARGFINKDRHINEAHAQSHWSYAVHGSFMLMETKLLIQNPFDEDFFLYGEEIDLCRRLYQAGRPCYYFADTTITHTGLRSEKSAIIRHQIFLSNALLVLKMYGVPGYSFFLFLRLFRAVSLQLLLPFVRNGTRKHIKYHLSDAKPFSSDYFRVLRYRRKLNSYLPLINRYLRAEQAEMANKEVASKGIEF